jgi:hypothetical protein
MSGYLHEDIELERATADGGLTGLYAGTIADTATGLTDRVAVLLDAFDPQLRFGPCRWMPRLQTVTINVAETGESTHDVDVAQAVLPARGDRCLVAFDDSETPWIVCWGPT